MKYIFTLSLFITGILSAFSQNTTNPLPDLLQNFQYQKALEYIETQEPTKDLLIQKALCYKALGEYKKSVDILSPLSQEYTGNIRILSELAACYQAMAQRQASIDCYNEFIRIDSANIYFKIQKAELLFQQNKYEKALELFYTIYDQGRSTNTLKQIAQCYEMMNEVDSAVVYYRKTLDENPLDGYSAASLTNICLKEGLLPEGKACSQAFMALDTTNLQVNLLNALCYYATEQEYEEAIARFLRCEQRGDNSLILNRNLGTSLYMTQSYYYAEMYLDKAFQQDTTNNTVLFALASSAMELGDHKKSIPLFNKLLNRVKPDSTMLSMCFRNLAASYQKGAKYKDAAETYIRSLDYLKPNRKMITYYTIANLYDNHLDDRNNALIYYSRYRETLVDYLNLLKEGAAEDNAESIRDEEKRIKALDERITDIKKGKKRESARMVIIKDSPDNKKDSTAIVRDTIMIKEQK
jgi:tetratricopeptide (TPR) repeat protein